MERAHEQKRWAQCEHLLFLANPFTFGEPHGTEFQWIHGGESSVGLNMSTGQACHVYD